jgi:hypothetical protein
MRGFLGEKVGEGATADIHVWAPGREAVQGRRLAAARPSRGANDPRRVRRGRTYRAGRASTSVFRTKERRQLRAVDPAQVVGAEGLPLGAIVGQQPQHSGMPKSGPCRAISVSRRYWPARSQREQAIARTSVWAATAARVIEPSAMARLGCHAIGFGAALTAASSPIRT